MELDRSKSILIEKYEKALGLDPKSRVFAPLAEVYRNLGMHDKAIHILKKGLQYHPSYVFGHLGLAYCYYDLGQYSMVYTILLPLVSSNRENIRLQRLFGKVCLDLSHFEEALETFKYLLFLNPKDKEATEIIRNIEDKISKEENLVVQEDQKIIPSEPIFEADSISSSPVSSELDEWVKLDLSAKENATNTNSEWKMEKLSPKSEELEIVENQDHIHNETKIENKEKLERQPVITHTLVDLYLGQGHMDKALEIVEKILELNPNDERSILKKEEILKVISQNNLDDEIDEESGHNQLMNLFDKKVGDKEIDIETDQNSEIEKKLNMFLGALHKRAENFKTSS